MTLEFYITIAAIIAGPFFAVLVTRYSENNRRNYERKHAVFRSLMKTRKTWASVEHVEALNLVEIEFHDKKEVLEAYKLLFDYFEKDIPRRDSEEDQSYLQRKAEHHSNLLSGLLLAMSKVLGYRHDQFGILRGGYSPILHGQIEQDQEKIRRLFASMAEGKAVLPVALVDVRHPDALLEEARNAALLIGHAQTRENEVGDG